MLRAAEFELHKLCATPLCPSPTRRLHPGKTLPDVCATPDSEAGARAYSLASASSRIQIFRKRTGWLWSCSFKGNLVGT